MLAQWGDDDDDVDDDDGDDDGDGYGDCDDDDDDDGDCDGGGDGDDDDDDDDDDDKHHELHDYVTRRIHLFHMLFPSILMMQWQLNPLMRSLHDPSDQTWGDLTLVNDLIDDDDDTSFMMILTTIKSTKFDVCLF